MMIGIFSPRRPLLVALMAAASSAVFAEEAVAPSKESDSSLPSTVVAASRVEANESSSTSLSLDEARERAFATPGSVSVVSSEAYRKGRAATLQDMMEFQPGVFTQTRSGQEAFRLSIRGSGIQRTTGSRGIMVQQDGIPLNSADGSFSIESLDPSAFSRIEVRRGASASGSGSGTLGGSINFVNHTGLDGPAARLSVDVGSYGFVRLSASASLANPAASPGSDLTATVTGSSSDGWRDSSDSRALRANANFGQHLGDHVENRFYIGYMDLKSLLPGAVTKTQLDNDPKRASAANIANPSALDAIWLRLADRVALTFDDARIELSAGWQGRELDHPAGPRTSAGDSHNVFAQAKIDYLADLLGHENRFTAGVTPSFGLNDSEAFVNPPGDARRGAKVQETQETARNVAVFLEDDFHVTRELIATAAVRFDYAGRKRTISLADPATLSPDDARTKDYFGVSPMFGVRREFAEGRRAIYANISRSFEAPSFSEFNTRRINNPDTVGAQKATTVEVGTRGVAGPVGWDVAVYQSWLKGEFITYNTPTRTNPLATSTINGGDTRRFGVEAAFEADLLGADLDAETTKLLLRHTLGWTLSSFHKDRQFGGNTLAGLPAFSQKTELLLRFAEGFYIGPNVEYVGSTYIDNKNTLKAEAFTLLGARAGRRARDGKGWSGYIEARNILDERYSATSSVQVTATPAGAIYNPGQGFSMYCGIEYTW